MEGLGSGYAHGCAPTAIPDVQRHALTGRGVEREADPAACCTHVHDEVQVLDTVMVSKRQWPPSSHPSQEQLRVDARGVMRQAWHHRLFVQAFPGARPMRSCTWPLRVNTSGSPPDRHSDKQTSTRGLSWPPSSSLTPGDALDAGRADARRLLRPPHHAASHHPACSHPRWLGPRWHAKQQHLA